MALYLVWWMSVLFRSCESETSESRAMFTPYFRHRHCNLIRALDTTKNPTHHRQCQCWERTRCTIGMLLWMNTMGTWTCISILTSNSSLQWKLCSNEEEISKMVRWIVAWCQSTSIKKLRKFLCKVNPVKNLLVLSGLRMENISPLWRWQTSPLPWEEATSQKKDCSFWKSKRILSVRQPATSQGLHFFA